jgi:hypothetical protein
VKKNLKKLLINKGEEMVECKIKDNKEKCNCTYPCDKKGICCECIEYHRVRGELPACYFEESVEKTYNRTIESFITNYKK